MAESGIAMRKVLQGPTRETPAVVQELSEESFRDPHPGQSKILTARQRDVLQLLAEGLTMKEAAVALHITARTVAFHKYRIMEEFNLHNNSDLIRFAIKTRVIPIF
jgi:DNA-binding NarL/FixJ family response regulator